MTDQIMSVFEGFRQEPIVGDQYAQVGREILSGRVDGFVGQGKPLEFVMLGFPFKSTNRRDKVLGPRPDLGELLTVKNFALFDSSIKQIYPQGTVVNIVSDGYVFNDILGVDDKEVQEYKEISQDMAQGSNIRFYDLTDFYGSSLSSGREKVMSLAPTTEKLQYEILYNQDTNLLYRGMIHFMEEELVASKEWPSRNQLQVAAKKLTRAMMMRNEAYSSLVRQEFANCVRISMHPSVNNGTKYSFQLIPGKKVRHSAWHSAVYVDGSGNVETMHKKTAIERGLILNFNQGQPWFFTDKN